MFRRTLIVLCLCVGTVIGAVSPIAHAAPLVVSAQANIFGAGHTTAPNPGGGGGGMLPPVFTFAAGPGKILQFSSVTGTVNCCTSYPQSPPTVNGPDGGMFGVDHTIMDSFGGISGIVHGDHNLPNSGKTMFLVGVFLDDSEPADPAPERLNFTGADNFLTLSPLLGQVFFIGDGLTGTGTGSVQQFHVPAGATRLFLGFADGMNDHGNPFHGLPGLYDDNEGQLTATLHITADSAVCDVQLNQDSYGNGDQVIAQVVQVVNRTTTPLAIEFKFWFEVPERGPMSYERGGADGKVVLPVGFNKDFGPVTLATVTSTLPRGDYTFNCRLLDPVSGELLTEDVQLFTLQ